MPLIDRRQSLALLAALAVPASRAQGFPAKLIRLVVPFPPGGPTDVVSRHIAQDWQARLGWQSVVENKAGASGFIAHEEVRRQAPDGLTLMALVTPAVVNYKFLNKPFALPAEFTPIGLVYSQYNILVVNPAAPQMARVRTVADLLAAARAAPGALNYTSAGNGSMGHLTTALLSRTAGVSMVHVPYRGDLPALADVLAGQVPMMFSSSTTALPHVRSGKLRAIAVSAATRVPELPDVPTLIESGFPGVVATPWFGLVAPPGMSQDLVGRITQALKETVANPDVQQKLQALGVTPHYLPPREFAEWVNKDYAVWSKVISDNGIQPS